MAKPTDRTIPVRTYRRALRLRRPGACPLCLRLGRTPNAETRRALRDADAGRNLLGPYYDVAAMFRDLGA